MNRKEAMELLSVPVQEVFSIVAWAAEVKRNHWGDTFQFCSIINAKSGLCDAGCAFCAQADPASTGAPVYPLVSKEELMEGARRAIDHGSARFSIVASGRGLTAREMERLLTSVEAIAEGFPGLLLDVSVGRLSVSQLRELKAAGVSRVHHNLESSESFYPKVAPQLSWRERYGFLLMAKDEGLEVCAGGLLGMGESREDWVDLAFSLREVQVDSVPLNFLIPVPGTPLQDAVPWHPLELLRCIAVFRLVLPAAELRICGGRERNLRQLQAIAATMVNGFMVGGYLTRGGREPKLDAELVDDLGLMLVKDGPLRGGEGCLPRLDLKGEGGALEPPLEV